MDNFDRKKHWNNIYQKNSTDKVSWYQPTPTISLEFVKQFNLVKTAKIIDIGCGDSYFIDHLINLGYQDITVLDILKKFFKKIKCITIDHKTPFDTIQNFIFCSFRRLGAI